MNDWVYSLVASYGVWVVAASAYLSCLAIPIPTAVIMLAAGAFAAAGDLVLGEVLLAGWLAAIAGDNTGFQIGRWGGGAFLTRVSERTGRHRLMARGKETVSRYGGVGVFFSTWLFAPLGPWVNLIAGAMGLNRWRFLLWDTAGETIWVFAYVLLGYGFGSQIDAVADLVGDWAAMLAALAVAVGFVVAIAVKLRKTRPRADRDGAAGQPPDGGPPEPRPGPVTKA